MPNHRAAVRIKTPSSNLRRGDRRAPGGTGFEAGSVCGDLASRSTAAPALPVAGASVELDSLLCSVISVGIGYPPIPSVSAERIKDQCAKIAHEEWPSIPGQPFWVCAKDTDKSEVSHCICTLKEV